MTVTPKRSSELDTGYVRGIPRLVQRIRRTHLVPVFSTCLFCHTSLGANQRIEHFPIGRRLAFDAARGRLWAVCPNCARWNLTPLEERWDAIEECEREYRDTTRRVSSDNIALARLKDGTDLVRIGQPLRPEFTAWRYGEHLRRRRRKYLIGATAAIVAAPALVFGGWWAISTFLLPGAALGIGGQQLWLVYDQVLEPRRRVGMLRLPDGSVEPMMSRHLLGTRIMATPEGEWDAAVPYRERGRIGPFTSIDRVLQVQGPEARRVARDVLPILNSGGGSRLDIHEAIKTMEEIGDEPTLLKRLSAHANEDKSVAPIKHGLLVLEMMLHEEDERRAMAGELGDLYARWEDAERIAKIADGELTPITN